MSLFNRLFVLSLGSGLIALGVHHWRMAETRAEEAIRVRGRPVRGYGARSWRIAGVLTVMLGLPLVVLSFWPS